MKIYMVSLLHRATIKELIIKIIIKQHWFQYLFVVKATVLKQQTSKFPLQTQEIDAS